MKTTGIGDVVLLSAVARDVAEAFPEADVAIVGSEENLALARTVDGVRTVELPVATPWKAVPVLRREGFDVILDFGQWSRLEALYAALAGGSWTAGFETPGQRRHPAYDRSVRHRDDVHELENYRRLVATLDVTSTSLPRFTPRGPFPVPRPRSYMVFHLWPGGYRSDLREWPLPRWRELAERMTRRGFALLLTGGRQDSERNERFIRSCQDGANLTSLAGRCSLAELIAVLADADCVVSVNTGVMHLSAAVGARTVALNGPTAARRWGPIGPRTVCIDSEYEGCGYLNLGFEYEGRRTDCMDGISVDRVSAAALELVHA